jgi:FkbM family methyltransferase
MANGGGRCGAALEGAGFRAHYARMSDAESSIYPVDIRGVALEIEEFTQSQALGFILAELDADAYGLDRIPFKPRDVVIDIGGHVGLFALYLARLHPGIAIYSFEPEARNFRHLAANIARNKALNVFAFNLAVTADGRPFELYRPPDNSGAANGYARNHAVHPRSLTPSVTLDEVFDRFVPRRCKLLKMDCEGAEHEILPASKAALARVDWFSAEFHINEPLRQAGHSNEGLEAVVAQWIPAKRTAVSALAMSD